MSRVHLARGLKVTWCGMGVKHRAEKSVCLWDGGEVRSEAPFDCEFCSQAIAKEVARLQNLCRDGVAFRVAALWDQTNAIGCGDNSCVHGRRGGLATNGGCRCDESQLRRAAQIWSAYAKQVEVML